MTYFNLFFASNWLLSNMLEYYIYSSRSISAIHSETDSWFSSVEAELLLAHQSQMTSKVTF